MTQPNPNQVDWLAFRYVAGEMTAAESAAWELRLADDQVAREAVAGAVELLEAVQQLPPESWLTPRAAPAVSSVSIPATSRRGSSRAWNLGLSLAAAVVVVVGVFAASRAVRHDTSPPLREFDVDDELATTWSRTRTSLNTESAEDISGDDTVATDEWPVNSEAGPLAAERPISNTPSWILAGMAGLVAEHDDADPTSNPASPKEL